MDCAAKFEREVAALPGVSRVSLNISTGRLVVEGSGVDVAVIKRAAVREGLRIVLPESETGKARAAAPGTGWKLLRVLISGLALAGAFLVEKFASSPLQYLPFYLAAMAVGGWGNIRRALPSAVRLHFNMSVLMTVALVGAISIGEWREGAVVAFLYSLSETLESWTAGRVRRAVRELMDLAPPRARIFRPGGGEVEVPVEEVRVGDLVLVRPGERVAMDGKIVRGESALNEAAITGEPLAVEKGPGDEVFAGTLNTYGYLEVEVTRLVEDSTISRIIQMVEEAQARRAPSQVFVERFAAAYTPAVMALAAAVALLPPLIAGQPWLPWVYRGLALLVAACPCALVVSTPVAVASAIGSAARRGVLIKGGSCLEAAGALKAVAFDKTGTLTKGQFAVTDVCSTGGCPPEELLRLAASLESCSEHPLARAVVRAAAARGLPVERAAEFAALPGLGARGMVDGRLLYLGSPRLFRQMGLPLETVEGEVARLEKEGKTVILLGTPQALLGILALADEVREEGPAAVASLKKAGILRTVMLTGDAERTARAVAARLGIDEYRAGLLPQDKVEAVRSLVREYGAVAMVGDGINDAPALAAATVGVALGGASTDAALETADVVLAGTDLTKLAFVLRLGRAALGVIRQNVLFSVTVKVFAVLAVFPGWLTLWLAILADMGASLLVTLNAMRLWRVGDAQGVAPAVRE